MHDCSDNKQRMNKALFASRHNVPSKAEDEKSRPQERGECMPDQRTGMAGTEVETKPEGSSQSQQLAGQEIHLSGTKNKHETGWEVLNCST